MSSHSYAICLGIAICSCALALLSARPSFGQAKKEALDASRYGYDLEQQGKLPEALYEYNKAIGVDPKYPYPVEHIGTMYQKLHNYQKAILFLKKAITLDSAFDDYNYYNLGTCYKAIHKLDSALIFYHIFLRRMNPVVPEDSIAVRDAERLIDYSAKSIELQKMPPNTDEPIKVGSDVNSKYDDFAPAITPDGSILYFTSRRPSSNTNVYAETKDYGDDIFASKKDDKGNWQQAIALGTPINSKDDEGAIGVNPDGEAVYYSLCRRADGYGDCDIYESVLTGTDWSKPKNVGRELNSFAWDAQPSISPDGSAMYFSSRRPGSIEGSEDIWVSYRGTDGSWGKPLNLGPTINTPYSERTPFIAADGVTLYFSSNGHPGFGGHDIFMTRKQADGTWSEPKNLGRPINGEDDDEFLAVPAEGKIGFYSARKGNGATGLDIYTAIIPKEFAPFPVTLIKGLVVDKRSRKPLGAKIELVNLATDDLVGSYHSNSATGKFYFPITAGKNYGITATSPGYIFYSQHYSSQDTGHYAEVNYQIELTSVNDTTEQIAENEGNENSGNNNNGNKNNGNNNENNTNNNGNPTTNGKNDNSGKNSQNGTIPGTSTNQHGAHALNNIFFDFNKATLRPESRAELRNLIRFLVENPKLKIQISGHTDSVGTAEYNRKLSQSRADAVREYLIEKGIAPTRVIAKGYGSSQPKAPNDTEENRQKNRRTEFTIISRNL